MRPMVAPRGPAMPTDAVASKGRQSHNGNNRFFSFDTLVCLDDSLNYDPDQAARCTFEVRSRL